MTDSPPSNTAITYKMEVYRLVRSKFAGTITASGRANRWNRESEHVLYAASSRSLAALEQLVHLDQASLADTYSILVLSVNEKQYPLQSISVNQLPANWKHFQSIPDLQGIGSSWYKNQSSVLLRVPSIIIEQEKNYLINTRHPDFKRCVKLVRTEKYGWDRRLKSPQ